MNASTGRDVGTAHTQGKEVFVLPSELSDDMTLELNVRDFILTGSEPEAVTVIYLAGDLDLFAVPMFAKALSSLPRDQEESATSHPRRRIIADLRELHFIDSAGIATLAQGRKRFGDAFAVATLPEEKGQVAHTLTLIRLDQYIPFLRLPATTDLADHLSRAQ